MTLDLTLCMFFLSNLTIANLFLIIMIYISILPVLYHRKKYIVTIFF